MTYVEVAPGRWVGMRGYWPRGRFVCPLCAGLRFHPLAEHRALVRLIRHPLEVEVWGEDDLVVVSKGHHPPGRFLAAIQADDDVAWALDLLDNPELDEDLVRHQWLRFIPGRDLDGEPSGRWWEWDPPGPGVPARGLVPFTVVDLP